MRVPEFAVSSSRAEGGVEDGLEVVGMGEEGEGMHQTCLERGYMATLEDGGPRRGLLPGPVGALAGEAPGPARLCTNRER
jgi:hypothetical protein